MVDIANMLAQERPPAQFPARNVSVLPAASIPVAGHAHQHGEPAVAPAPRTGDVTEAAPDHHLRAIVGDASTIPASLRPLAAVFSLFGLQQMQADAPQVRTGRAVM